MTNFTAIRLCMQLAGVSQADLAREIGVSRQWISQVLAGRVPVNARFRRGVVLVIGKYLPIDEADEYDLYRWFFGSEQVAEVTR